MSMSGDTAEQVTRMGVEVTEQAIRLVCLGAKNLAALLLAYATNPENFKGNTSLKNLLKDGRHPVVFNLTDKEFEGFKKEAHTLGIPYAKVKNPQKPDSFDVIVREDDLDKVKIAFNHQGITFSEVIYEDREPETPEDRRQSVKERIDENRDLADEKNAFTEPSLDDLDAELFTPDMLGKGKSPLGKNININTGAARDGIEMICGDDMLFNKYLELQAWNPEVSVIELADIFSRYGQNGALYLPDYTVLTPQSTALATVPGLTLSDSQENMSTALTEIIRMSPAKIYSDSSLPSIARYSPEDRIIRIDPQMSEGILFAPLSREMSLALYHKNQGDSFSRDNTIFEASSISSILANRFDLPYDCVGNIAQKTQGASPMGKARFLESIRGISGKIGKGIENSVHRAGRTFQRSAQPKNRDNSR